MQDRVPLYPGRVRLTPVAGQENTYDMVRADQPSQAGTPLNKDSLLKDATAALFGLGADAVPDELFSFIKKWIDEFSPNSIHCIFGKRTGDGLRGGFSISFSEKPKAILLYSHEIMEQGEQKGNSFFAVIGEDATHVMGSCSDSYYLKPSVLSVTWNDSDVSIKTSSWSDNDTNSPFNIKGRIYGYILFV